MLFSQILISMGVIFIVSPLMARAGSAALSYSVMIDAGSSGTRIYVYSWTGSDSSSAYPVRDIRQLAVAKVEPGLSSLVEDLDSIEAQLATLIETANIVPKPARSVTPIYLFATAGMRLLPSSDQDRVLSVAAAALSRSPFLFSPNYIAVITGMTEALYGWVAANFLEEKLGAPPEETSGTVEMGGASVQITFALSEKSSSPVSSYFSDSIITVKFRQRTYSIFAKSFNRFGSNEILSKILERPPRDHAACFNKGQTLPTRDVHLGSGDPTLCTSLIVSGLNASHCAEKPCTAFCRCGLDTTVMPNVPSSMPFIAMSSFMYTMAFFDDTAESKIDPLLVRLNNSARKFCSKPWASVQDIIKKHNMPASAVPGTCLRGLYVPEILTKGLGFQATSKNIAYPQSIKYSGRQFDIEWVFGATIFLGGLAPISSPLAIVERKSANQGTAQSVWFSLTIVFGLLFFLVLYLHRRFVLVKKEESSLETSSRRSTGMMYSLLLDDEVEISETRT